MRFAARRTRGQWIEINFANASPSDAARWHSVSQWPRLLTRIAEINDVKTLNRLKGGENISAEKACGAHTQTVSYRPTERRTSSGILLNIDLCKKKRPQISTTRAEKPATFHPARFIDRGKNGRLYRILPDRHHRPYTFFFIIK